VVLNDVIDQLGQRAKEQLLDSARHRMASEA